MWEILDVLRRVSRGESKTAIRRATGRTRKTVRRYIERARKLGWDPGGGVQPDEALALEVARSLKPVGQKSSAGSSESQLTAHREQIRQWLFPQDASRGLRLTKVHELLGRQGLLEVDLREGARRGEDRGCQCGRADAGRKTHCHGGNIGGPFCAVGCLRPVVTAPRRLPPSRVRHRALIIWCETCKAGLLIHDQRPFPSTERDGYLMKIKETSTHMKTRCC